MSDSSKLHSLDFLTKDVDDILVENPDLSTMGKRFSKSDYNHIMAHFEPRPLSPFNLYLQELYSKGSIPALSEFFEQDVTPERFVLYAVNKAR